ncbi:hypothetical protein CD351_05745 [Erythrobacter sp. KY5]|uniref:class I SAM-dependent methyltransferase n=1 Tax=Erythrobacter sp. KY5 TaxID=2011159 RepID=UPI000DBF1AE4|nr:class I SAM-dependent methyltransferase [Erythrobacter sp. KY5]AWW73926.1 hypothetical protein CD351_05745 [Erythrobacter sp. KY5]
MTDDAKAWGDFWAHNTAQSGSMQATGCLPQRWAAIEDAQRAAWRGFAQDLPEGARVLDLATGNGIVLGWMKDARSDLSLTGIDLAPTLPAPPEGVETRGSVAMEDLPFEDGSFEAVVSQFGFEYGHTAKVAAEIARVLSQGGAVGLMVHRGDGPILEHNRQRRAEIEWALDEKKVVEAVTRALKTPGAGPPVGAQVASVLARLGAAQFGESSPAWEIPEAIRRACLIGQRQGIEAALETVAQIRVQADNEIGRIQSLSRACSRADDRTSLANAFEACGLAVRSTEPVAEPSGRALADFLTIR